LDLASGWQRRSFRTGGVTMYKVIVVGTDGSARAGIAVKEALALAKITGATLHAVHGARLVSMTGVELGDPASVMAANEDMRQSGDKILARVLADAKHEGVSAEGHNIDGDPGDVLIKLADRLSADLIVIGNRGMTGLKRLVLGSVPNKVSHHCPCSLLIVNTDSE
jgi:nucleotide-binding universal stress UspA family protein